MTFVVEVTSILFSDDIINDLSRIYYLVYITNSWVQIFMLVVKVIGVKLCMPTSWC